MNSEDEYKYEHRLETYKSLITISIEAMKTLWYLNGGAIVALLAYLGQAKDTQGLANNISGSIYWFIGGLALSVFTFIGSYMTQLRLFQEDNGPHENYEKHQYCLYASLLMAVISIFSFVVGACLGIAALSASPYPSYFPCHL